MKLFKKLIAVSMTVTMAAAIVGCSGGDAAADSSDAEALLKKANETMATVKSASMDFGMDFGLKMDEESMDMAVNSTIDYIDNDGIKMYMKMGMTVNGQSMGETETYAQEENKFMTTYANLGGTWTKAAAPLDDFQQYNAAESMKIYLENLSSFKTEGNEKINDVDTTIISGVLSGDAMKEAMATSVLDSLKQSFALTEEDAKAVLDGLGELPVKLWIAEDGHVMKIDMDMSEMMQTIMKEALSAAGDTGAAGTLEVSKASVSMTYKNFDAVEDFEIPAEALAAA